MMCCIMFLCRVMWLGCFSVGCMWCGLVEFSVLWFGGVWCGVYWCSMMWLDCCGYHVLCGVVWVCSDVV